MSFIPCGGHFDLNRRAFKALQACYYWPTLHHDGIRYTSRCDQWERMGKPTKRDVIPLNLLVALEPFYKWAIDFIGSIHPKSG